MQIITREEIIETLKEELRGYSSQSAFADKLGVYPSFLNAVLWGHRAPGFKIMEHLGIEEIKVYKKKEQ